MNFIRLIKAGSWGTHYSESDGYLNKYDYIKDYLVDFLDSDNYNDAIEAIGLYFDIVKNKDLYYNDSKDDLEKFIKFLENLLKIESFSTWKNPANKKLEVENLLGELKSFLKNTDSRSTTLLEKFNED